MWRAWRNWRLHAGLAIVAGLLAVALWPQAVPVETAVVGRGPLVVTIDEEGETRVRDRFVVSAPVAGRLLRIALEPGDSVARNTTVLARLLPEPPALLDARTLAEAQAAARAAEAGVGRASAELDRAVTAQQLAAAELRRVRELFDAGLATAQALDAREAEARAADEAVRAAGFAASTAEAELQRARARLRPAPAAAGAVVEVKAPVTGVVLRRLRESESVVRQGEPLVEIGDPSRIELVSDLLSSDAVRVAPGARVIVEAWGGDRPLAARVRRVEPSAFTKISALGVEEQRVNVVMDVEGPADAWAALGDGYRVEVRIVVSEGQHVLLAPGSALFRRGDRWAVYVVEGGRARQAFVEPGRRSGRDAEILSGLQDGDVVVAHPGDTLQEGARVEVRTPR
ncbi:MAG: efflux RND transporter periplasmic adaptor subunit [Acidobacteriota bacterium]